MITDITQNELILLAYNELPPDKHSALLQEVRDNISLYARYLEIKQQMKELDSLISSPNPTSVQIVLEESCSASPLEII